MICVQERSMAAVKIQKVVRNYLQKRRAKKQNEAAVVIQAIWRGHAVRNRVRCETEARLQASQHKAAAVIQVGVFSYISKNGCCLCCCNFSCFSFTV